MQIRKAQKWEARMLQIAKLVASFSKDPSTQVGTVIYNPIRKTVITTGYNGFPRGTLDNPSLYADREIKYPRVVHAEANAIVEAAAQGITTQGAILASTHPPCCDCAGLIIQAGISQIIYHHTEDNDMKRLNGEQAIAMLKETNIPITGVILEC